MLHQPRLHSIRRNMHRDKTSRIITTPYSSTSPPLPTIDKPFTCPTASIREAEAPPHAFARPAPYSVCVCVCVCVCLCVFVFVFVCVCVAKWTRPLMFVPARACGHSRPCGSNHSDVVDFFLAECGCHVRCCRSSLREPPVFYFKCRRSCRGPCSGCDSAPPLSPMPCHERDYLGYEPSRTLAGCHNLFLLPLSPPSSFTPLSRGSLRNKSPLDTDVVFLRLHCGKARLRKLSRRAKMPCASS